MYLLDTNVVSELRRGDRAHPMVRSWRLTVSENETFLSVIVLGELAQGIALLRPRDPVQATHLSVWLDRTRATYRDRIIPIDERTALFWGEMGPDRRPAFADGLIAATAIRHSLTVVTRNVRDFGHVGVRVLNPFV
jgi:predicted nucleic acid-binding protein